MTTPANVQVKKPKKCNREELLTLSKEDLIRKLEAAEAQNVQLKALLARSLEKKKNTYKNKPFDFAKCAFRRIFLKFYYLGWDYQGYAVQEDTSNTIEAYLFEALLKTCLIEDRTKSNYHRCGRTDKGVSAFCQVISIDVRSKLEKDKLDNVDDEIDYCKILNKVLPDNIQCVAWRPITENISARFDCQARTYKYFFPKGTLNIDKMIVAANYLVGTHDFRNLCKMDVGNGVTQFTRSIFSIEFSLLRNSSDSPFAMFVATIKSKSFLWHQIRCLMAVLFLVGEQREEPEVVKDLLNVDKNPRKPEYNMASEVPLNLYHCDYELEENWVYSKETLSLVYNKLQTIWCFESIKTTMIQSMLNDLVNSTDFEVSYSLTDQLLNGVKPKIYTPLMQRKKCESLESKIEHYVKRKRLEIVEEKIDDS